MLGQPGPGWRWLAGQAVPHNQRKLVSTQPQERHGASLLGGADVQATEQLAVCVTVCAQMGEGCLGFGADGFGWSLEDVLP